MPNLLLRPTRFVLVWCMLRMRDCLSTDSLPKPLAVEESFVCEAVSILFTLDRGKSYALEFASVIYCYNFLDSDAPCFMRLPDALLSVLSIVLLYASSVFFEGSFHGLTD